jgi:hypothetical protein
MSMRSDLQAPSNQEPQEKKRWVEPVTALLMALATLNTAWCSYQSAAFTRKSNRLMNEFNSLERRASLYTMQGMQQATIHTAMFMELLAAQHDGNEKLANFYAERFPPDVRKAYDAWLAQKPFENPNADPHPFVPNLYEVRGTREAAEATAKAASSALAKLPDKSAATIDLTTLGDPFMFQDHYGDRTPDQVANVFGTKFAEELFKLRPREWNGPVESGLGWHLVWVESITPGRTPEFEEVDISQIKSQWLSAQRAETKHELFEAMRGRYEIVLPRGQQSVADTTSWHETR